MRDSRIFSVETRVVERDVFVFRCHDPRRGNRWMFVVNTSALRELQPNDPFDPVTAFGSLRAAIYGAACRRMRFADPMSPQELSSEDLWVGLDLESSRPRLLPTGPHA